MSFIGFLVFFWIFCSLAGVSLFGSNDKNHKEEKSETWEAVKRHYAERARRREAKLSKEPHHSSGGGGGDSDSSPDDSNFTGNPMGF